MLERLNSDAARLTQRTGIPIKLTSAERRGFDGGETITLVISVVVSGIAGGILSSVGKDLWGGVKQLVGATRDSRGADAYQVIVIDRVGTAEVHYVCRVDDLSDIDRLVDALGPARADPPPTGKEHVTLLLVNGEWQRLP